jgi:acyl-CoA synthetase (AMP-forming)/AMP-acid ligase II
MLGALLQRAAASDPDAIAFIDDDRRLTYAEWDWLSDRAAFALWSEGVRPGDVVALLLQPGFSYPIAYLGAAKIGAITCGINTRLSQREVDHILDDSRAVVLISDRDDLTPEPGLLHPDELNRPGAQPERVTRAPDDPVLLVYTSGTTGLPKGAVFTEGALEAVRRIEAAFDPTPRTVGLQQTPMAHMGFMTKIASFIDRRASTVLMKGWKARAALELIERERVTALGGVPTQLALMLMEPDFARFDLSSLRSCLIGGAPAAPDLIRRIRSALGVPVSVRFSCTELALCTATRPDDADDVVAHTVGRPLPEVDVRIASPNADGIGEVCARSPAMFSGYWHADRALDDDGYYHTGDLGRIDADGNLRLAGRAKEMYVRGGYNVFPVEVENVLRAHPKVAMVAVIGIGDEVLGERGKAFVVAVDPADPPTLAELRASASSSLADYKLPDVLEVRAELPLTSMHKVDKSALA